MSKKFLNMHVLISHSPSCLNRDDMNMQKSAVFGGKRRVRVSSQSLKRAIRTSDYYQKNLGNRSIRTRELQLLADKMYEELQAIKECDLEKQWIDLGVELFSKSTVSSAEDGDAVEDEYASDGETKSKVAVAPWSIREFQYICEAIRETFEEPLTEKESDSLRKAIEKEHGRKATKKKPKLTEEQVKKDFLTKKVKRKLSERSENLRSACGSAIDIALSGRMATSGLMTSVDGALAVAHAITTHTVDADIDWFTAVDDLIVEEGDVGAGHLNTQEFSSGVFYRYASLNIPQLQENLGDCSRERALEIAAHVMHLFATIVPSAKQQTFAAHNLADTVLLSFADQPLSLANAFETPVQADRRDGGFRLPSTLALIDHYKKLSQAYGLAADARLFTLLGAETEMDTVVSINELAQWITAQE